jgi:hypothetical protein
MRVLHKLKSRADTNMSLDAILTWTRSTRVLSFQEDATSAMVMHLCELYLDEVHESVELLI